jgi:hypothetical protein
MRIEFQNYTPKSPDRLDEILLAALPATETAQIAKVNLLIKYMLEDKSLEEIAAYAAVISKHKDKIASLDLSGNNLSSDAIKFFTDVLAGSESLSSFSAERNNLTSAGAAKIAEMVRETPNLKIVNLDTDHMGIQGVRMIAEACKESGVKKLSVKGASGKSIFLATPSTSLDEIFAALDLTKNTEICFIDKPNVSLPEVSLVNLDTASTSPQGPSVITGIIIEKTALAGGNLAESTLPPQLEDLMGANLGADARLVLEEGYLKDTQVPVVGEVSRDSGDSLTFPQDGSN